MLIYLIGNKIKERRKVLGITQELLAELSGVNVNTIIRIENSRINPTLEVVGRIADVLGMELSLEIKQIRL